MQGHGKAQACRARGEQAQAQAEAFGQGASAARKSGTRVFNAAGERVFTDKKRSERYAALNSELRGCP
jgi:hypothetical protein